MTADPNINATAESVSDKLDGLVDGQRLDYETVDLLAPSEIHGLGTSYAYPESRNTSSSVMDKTTTLAKVLTRTYVASDGKTYDMFDAMMTVLEKHLAAGS